MKIKKVKPAKGFKDVFNLHMVEDARLVGNLEMPYISKYNGPLPTKITNCNAPKLDADKYFIHFYLFDYYFDNKNGLWYGSQRDSSSVNKFLEKLNAYEGVIAPDYSIYTDMPLIMQLWNIYRVRAIHAWLTSLGYNCIFNIRWGDYRTYDVAFFGIEKHSTLSVGSHGLIKNILQRHTFMTGFVEMIKRVEPANLVIYGPYTEEMKTICDQYSVNVIHFDSEQTESRK